MAGCLRVDTTMRQIDVLAERLRRHRGLASVNPEYRRALEVLAAEVADALIRGLASAESRRVAAGVDVVDVEHFATWESELGER
jgi:hypothetical protein